MTSPEDRIKEIVRRRGLEDADASRLLASVGKPEARETNPFRRWSGETTSLVAIPIAALGLLASRFGVRFDGALDLHHSATNAVSTATALGDQLVAVPLTALVFFLAARATSKTARFVDVLGVVAVARIAPTLLAIPIAFLGRLLPADPLAGPGLALAGLVVLALVALGAQVTLLVQGFATVTAARGRRLALAFVAALVCAEIASKVALAALHR